MFKNPIAPKMKKSSKTFAAPSKEAATTGGFMAAGDFYGTGFRAKIGKEKVSASSPILRKAKKSEAPKSIA